jgi:adhesin/invasin
MLTGFMITRPNGLLALLAAAACSLLVSACEKVPLMAPAGSTIILTASTNAMPVGATTDIIAQVLEAAGTPPHSGTRVTFTTTLGTLEPAEANTDVGGRVVVRFLSGTANGSAVITATSGGATTGTNGALKIAVGTAAVGRVSVNANPALVPANGGSTTIAASLFDINGNLLPSAPVSFTTTAGTLSSSIVSTDANGVASTTLTTSQQATVTASVGAQAPPAGTGTGGTGTGTGTGTTSSGQASGTVVVNVASAPSLVITPPSSPPSVGLPANFTFAVTAAAQNGSAVRELRVNWGDGETSNLGAVTGNAVVSHVFDDDGTFTVTGTVTDVTGNSVSVSTSVTVIPVPRPTIIITYSPVPAHANTQTTITIQVTVPPGIGVTETRVNFGDGTSANLGGATSANVQHVYTLPGTYTLEVSVRDTTNNTTVGSTSVSVGL